MGLFGKARPAAANHPLAKYAAARSNLLAMLALTVINFILTIAQADTYFLFSATFPQASLIYGYVLEAEGLPGLYVAGIVLGVVCIGLYFLCWLLSKKNGAWMTVAAVLFAIDTVLLFLVYEIQADVIIDVVFHAWVLYYLISGAVAYGKLKNLPPEEQNPPAEAPADPYGAPVEGIEGGYPVAPQPMETLVINGEPVTVTEDGVERQ